MANITFNHIFKKYPGDVTAVNDFDMMVKDKEFVVLVGPSGCGKSTTLRMIAGLEEITGGELFIGDKLVNDVPPKDRDIAMVFQNYALYPHMTVYKNMAFGLELRKTPKHMVKDRVKEVAKILNIEQLLDRKPKALSGGERQRVALGRAMVRNPVAFLLDEPLSNLDAKLRTSMRTELIRLHNQLETTFIYVTHDQTEAMTMGDRIVVMKDGFIQQVDTPQNLYNKPQNVFVAGFIGSPQMNFLEGKIEEKGGKLCFTYGKNSLFIPQAGDHDEVKKYTGKPIKLGIRPENMYMGKNADASKHKAEIDAIVEVYELLGNETILYLKCGDQKMTARVAPTTVVETGMNIKISLDMERIHLFDSETEERVSS